MLQYQPRSARGTDKGTGLAFAAVVSPAPEHWDQYLQYVWVPEHPSSNHFGPAYPVTLPLSEFL